MKCSSSGFTTGFSFRNAGLRTTLCLGSLLVGGTATQAQIAAGASTSQTAVASGTQIEALPGQFSTSAAPLIAEATLPEAPLPQSTSARRPAPAGTSDSQPVAPRRAGVIPAGMRGQPETARDKVAVGVGELVNYEGLAAMLLSAGYEHALNSEPNYGTDKGAFGQRLGAAALREESQAVFTYMVFAPLLHQDARYYVEGPTYNPVHRTLYAITRPLITRNDSGHNSINATLLLGYAASAALTPAYYPSSNRNAHDVASVYGGSIGGAALGFFVNEFTDDALIALHLKHRQ